MSANGRVVIYVADIDQAEVSGVPALRPVTGMFSVNGTGALAVGLKARGIEGSLIPGEVFRAADTDARPAFPTFNGTNQLGLAVVARAQLFNGATWDRVRSASAANLAAQSALGAQLTAPPGQWTVPVDAAPGVAAVATRAAGGAGVRHVCTSITASLQSVGPGGGGSSLVLRDGASGVGTILWRAAMNVLATPSVPDRIVITGLNIIGSPATAMTLEFAAGVANVVQDVTLGGYSTT